MTSNAHKSSPDPHLVPLLVLTAIEAKRREIISEYLLFWFLFETPENSKNPAEENALSNGLSELRERSVKFTDPTGLDTDSDIAQSKAGTYNALREQQVNVGGQDSININTGMQNQTPSLVAMPRKQNGPGDFSNGSGEKPSVKSAEVDVLGIKFSATNDIAHGNFNLKFEMPSINSESKVEFFGKNSPLSGGLVGSREVGVIEGHLGMVNGSVGLGIESTMASSGLGLYMDAFGGELSAQAGIKSGSWGLGADFGPSTDFFGGLGYGAELKITLSSVGGE